MTVFLLNGITPSAMALTAAHAVKTGWSQTSAWSDQREARATVDAVPRAAQIEIQHMINRAMPRRLLNVFAHSSGGGKFLAVLQF